MLVLGDDSGKQNAPQTHPTHEAAEQDRDGNRRSSDHQTEQMKPDDLIDQGSAAAADEQQKQRRGEPTDHSLVTRFRRPAEGFLLGASVAGTRNSVGGI